MRALLAGIFVLLLSGCSGGCGEAVLQACPLSPRTADTDTASGGFASVTITNDYTYPITVNEVGVETTGYLSGKTCGFPLYPRIFALSAAQSQTMTGTFTGCYVGDLQAVWLFITQDGRKATTCDYAVTYDPVGGSFVFPFISSLSADYECDRQASGGTASITYKYSGS